MRILQLNETRWNKSFYNDLNSENCEMIEMNLMKNTEKIIWIKYLNDMNDIYKVFLHLFKRNFVNFTFNYNSEISNKCYYLLFVLWPISIIICLRKHGIEDWSFKLTSIHIM